MQNQGQYILKLLLLVTLASQSFQDGLGFNCHYYSEKSHKYFDLLQLRGTRPLIAENIPVQFKGTQYQASMTYNFCLKVDAPSGCPTDSSSAYVHFKDSSQQNQCFPLTDLIKSDWKNTYLTLPVSANVTQHGVQMLANNTKNAEKMPYNMAYKILCPLKNQNSTKPTVSYDNDSQTIFINAIDKSGCGTDFSSFFDFVSSHKWIFSIIMAVAGLFLILLGNHFIKGTLALIGFLVGSAGILALFLTFWNYHEADTKQVIAISFISMAVGIGLGAAMYFITKLAITVSGGFLGFFVTTLLTGLYNTNMSNDLPTWAFILAAVVICAVFALVGFCAHDHIMIFSTSLGGAYLLMRGIGTAADNYPDEFTMAKDIKYGKFTKVPVWFWVYFGGFIVCSIIGLVIQYRRHCQNKKKKEEDSKWEDTVKEDDDEENYHYKKMN